MKRYLALGTFALLAACSGSEGNNSSDSAAGATQTQADTPNADSGNEMVPLPPQPNPTPVVNGMPADYQGRWGMTYEDCMPGRADAKGLMIVSADGMGFYESRAAIQKVVGSTPGTLTLDLKFSGEGSEWDRQETLTLLDDGKTLVRQEQKPAGSYRYSKCPAGKEVPQT